jgi:uncharacterized protein YecT (DUF1311 family)
MNRKLYTTLSIMAVTTTMLTACGNTSNKANSQESSASETVIDNFEEIMSNETENNQQSDVSEVETVITTESAENETVSKDYTFEDLSKYNYEFCSGAGGWSTDFYIEKDGYFHGNYHDSEMGVTGDGYENGTMYSSVFTGHFSGLTKVDDYAYEMVMSDISYKDEVGTEEIEIIDNIKYIYDEAYGLCGTKRFLVYFVGTPVNIFDEEVYWWIKDSVDTSAGDNALLQTPVIVNEDQQYGIYSYERLSPAEEAEINYNSYKQSYDYLNELLTEATTTGDMLIYANKSYENADSCLNCLWNLIKYNTDNDTFQTILEEQRSWLKQRDEQATTNRDSWEGGTFAEVDYQDTMATMTMERCETLLEYVKQECN